jgi:hypothetical protein
MPESAAGKQYIIYHFIKEYHKIGTQKMNYTSVKNPKWTSDERTSIECIVNFENIGEVPFAATPDDQHDHTTEIYNRCVAGEFGEIAEYVKPEPLEYNLNSYRLYRKNEYPKVEVYLDAVVKGDQAAIDKYIADCKAVKEKYPKP